MPITLPDAATMSARWKDRQTQIDTNLKTLNANMANTGKMLVRNPTNANQFITIDTQTPLQQAQTTTAQATAETAPENTRAKLLTDMQSLTGGKSFDPQQVQDFLKGTSDSIPTPVGLTKTEQATQMKNNDALSSLVNTVTDIQAASDAINTQSSPTGTYSNPLQWLTGMGKHALGDQNAAYLNDQVTGMLNQITSSLAGTNRFSPYEIQALHSAIPSATDTKEQAAFKINKLKQAINTKIKAVGGTTSSGETLPMFDVPAGTPDIFAKNTSQPSAQSTTGAFNNRPSGGQSDFKILSVK